MSSNYIIYEQIKNKTCTLTNNLINNNLINNNLINNNLINLYERKFLSKRKSTFCVRTIIIILNDFVH